MSDVTIRAGDSVKHRPSGETWLVAYVDGERLAWCGWPPGEAALTDCELVKRCSDDENLSLLKRLAEMREEDGRYDRRKANAIAALKQLGIEL